MRSSSLPPDSEVLEQQPELLSWEDSDAPNKMVSKAHHATYSNYDYLTDASSGELKKKICPFI